VQMLINVDVDDLNKAIQFYESAFGLKMVGGWAPTASRCLGVHRRFTCSSRLQAHPCPAARRPTHYRQRHCDRGVWLAGRKTDLCAARLGFVGSSHCALASNRIARVLFMLHQGEMVLLHGFIKKTQKAPQSDLDLARKRLKEVTR
jgi:hypothetical protein